MKFKKSLFVLCLFLIFSCSSQRSTLSEIKGILEGSEAIIINSLGESVSAVRNEGSRSIVNNVKDIRGKIFNTGSAPNQILVRGKLGYILNSTSNNIQVVNLETMLTVSETSTGTGSSPFLMTFYGKDRLYVTNLLGSDNNGNVGVLTVNPDGTLRNTATISLPSGESLEPFADPSFARPQGICVSNSKIYVTLTNLSGWFAGGPGFVVVIDPQTNSVAKKIKTQGLNPSMAYCSDKYPDKVFVLHAGTFIGDGLVDVINSETDEITATVATGGAPYSMTVTDDGKAFVSDALGPHLMSFDAEDYSIIKDASDPIQVADPAASPFNFISFIDTNREGNLFALAFNSDELYILDANSAQIIDGPYLTGDGPISMVLDK